jgi:hypothetical protein
MRTGRTRECEEAADLARANLAATVDQLRTNLGPGNLIDEVVRGSGWRDIDAANVLEFAAQRHPIPTLLIAVGAGFWVSSTLRSRTSANSEHRGSVSATVAALASPAARVLRARVEARREALLAKASAHIAAKAEQLSDAVEKNIENLVGRMPESGASRPLIASAVQIAMLAMLESLFPRRRVREAGPSNSPA